MIARKLDAVEAAMRAANWPEAIRLAAKFPRLGTESKDIMRANEALEAAGARYYNEAILVTAVGSLPIRVGKQFRSGRKLGKTHQNVLVFCKGDPKRATQAIEGTAA